MKKFILPIVLVVFIFFLFLSPHVAYAGTDVECRPVFDRDMSQCTKDFNKCQDVCRGETKKPDGTAYFNSGEIYDRCTKASQCLEKNSECGDKALEDFWACRKSDKKPDETTKDKPKEAEKATPLLDKLGINPFQLWLNFRDLFEFQEILRSGEGFDIESFILNLAGKKSTRQKEAEMKPWWYEEAIKEAVKKGQIDGKVETDAWILPVSQGEPVIDVPGTVDTKRYSWDENSGVVAKSNDWEKIKFREPIEVGGLTSHTLELGEGIVEVKVRNNNQAENQFGVDAGWLGVTVSRTHFLVLKDTDKKLVAVVVYEGEVKVKTRDGKTVSVTPSGDQPGLVVISQKLSPVKLAAAGLVLVIILGGAVWFLKRKKK